ncbi:MAG: hypothetical protein K0U93_24640, partial [Gammaproteobacteria bacterium]|nr:hypothetical protein [Gammaproteobacteria bacterium]
MSAIAHFIESAGIATATISLVREHSAAMQPPRSLWVTFPLGRPLGMPHDASFQHGVLRALMGLTTAGEGPVLRDYDVDLPQSSDGAGDTQSTWACPVSFPSTTKASDTLESRIEAELAALSPWYEIAKSRRQRSTFGASQQAIGEVAGFLCG